MADTATTEDGNNINTMTQIMYLVMKQAIIDLIHFIFTK